MFLSETENMKYNIALIYGSVRTNRQGIRAARYLNKKLNERAFSVTLVDPLEYPLPLLDKMFKEYQAGKAPKNMEKIGRIFRQADGFLILSGEYNHSIPPALKNILDHYQSEYLFKPSAIATYSAGSFGGMRVAMHLRALTAELGMPSISSILPFPEIASTINENGQPQNSQIEKSTNRFLDEFEWYLAALKTQREKGVPF